LRCPTIAELPPPPLGKTGWPWTVETPQLGPTHSDGLPWARISIVTPSYNQGHFIEETIRSVLLQGYPDLEYIIFDGSSSDESVNIIQKYERWLSYWASEKDRGQAHAINKGFCRSTGELLAWLNSDDCYEMNALSTVASNLPVRGSWAVGECWEVPANETSPMKIIPEKVDGPGWLYRFARGSTYAVPQPATFWTRTAWQSSGELNEQWNFAFDHEYFLRLLKAVDTPLVINSVLARYRHHPAAKTSTHPLSFKIEGLQIAGAHAGILSFPDRAAISILTARNGARFEFLRLVESNPPMPSISDIFALLVKNPILIIDSTFISTLLARLFARASGEAAARPVSLEPPQDS
jgi:glycosyltransferase involved in cell wall biosynthesis